MNYKFEIQDYGVQTTFDIEGIEAIVKIEKIEYYLDMYHNSAGAVITKVTDMTNAKTYGADYFEAMPDGHGELIEEAAEEIGKECYYEMPIEKWEHDMEKEDERHFN